MRLQRIAGVWLVCQVACGAWAAPVWAAQTQASTPESADTAPLFRVFLKDGSSLISYGELARVDDRVVFSMPTSASLDAPQLQLINIASDRVDWERTVDYADAIRSKRYLATRAEADYAALSDDVAQALNEVGDTADPARRLAIVEQARKALADWPAAHYDYKRDEIQQTLNTLDEAINSLRAESGGDTFDLSLVATGAPPPRRERTLLPPPSPRESIEQTLRAAALTASPVERVSLLTVALNALEAEAKSLPTDWVSRTRTEVRAQIAREQQIDRQYQALSARMLRLATARARMADVRGVQRVIGRIRANDKLLGSRRPETVVSIEAAVEAQLEEARRLRLERDRWSLRAPELRAYRYAVAGALDRLQRMTPLLESIKALTGSGPDALGSILRSTAQMKTSLQNVQVPEELREVHAFLSGAVQLAESAATVRREATITGNMARAWDASSAAAGALMLAGRARDGIALALRPPQLDR